MLMGVGNPPVDGKDDYAPAAEAFRQGWKRLLSAVRATPDPQRHFDRATEAGQMLAEFVSENADERADAAVRIKDAESLTLTVLGKRTRMTKQAAGRLTSRARRKQKEQ
jgi:hypothetical protein